MTKELNEDSGFKVSIKTLVWIGAAMATIISTTKTSSHSK